MCLATTSVPVTCTPASDLRQLRSLKGLQALAALDTLDVGSNAVCLILCSSWSHSMAQIIDMVEVRFVRELPLLRVLILAKNPLEVGLL